MADQDFTIRWYDMTIDGLDGKFVVCKLRRVSSSPVLVGNVSNSLESSFLRLADSIRLGRHSRNYQDLKAIEWLLKQDFQTTAEAEWAEYEKVICRSLGLDRLDSLLPTIPPMSSVPPSCPAITYHEAMMNERPYLVAAVGGILGSPAPVFLTWGHERESALDRLKDVFRVGVRGQVFRDFVEAGRRLGKGQAESVKEWKTAEERLRRRMDG